VDEFVSDAGPVALLDRQINPEASQGFEQAGVGERPGVLPHAWKKNASKGLDLPIDDV
jgi:hypothetical protein